MKQIFGILAVAIVLGVGAARPQLLVAQTALERLEDQIRNQAGPGSTTAKPDDAPLGAPSPRASRPQGGERPYLGAMADDRADRGRGVRVLEVRPSSPADQAGLRPQDLITSANDTRVRQLTDLMAVMDVLVPGDRLALEITRDGQSRRVDVVLGQRVARTEPPRTGTAENILAPPTEPLGGPALTTPPQPAPLGGDATRVEQLQRRVDQLERRIEELERAMAESHKKQ